MPRDTDKVRQSTSRPEPSPARCALCERDVPQSLVTLHHLLPKEHGGQAEHRVPFCKPCHKQVHALFSNRQLATTLNTLEALRAAPELATFLAWIRRQKPDRNFRTITATDHLKRRKR
jgi:5-methylcytosine-specific restriction protein A